MTSVPTSDERNWTNADTVTASDCYSIHSVVLHTAFLSLEEVSNEHACNVATKLAWIPCMKPCLLQPLI